MDESFILKILKEMVEIPTVVPPGENYREFVEFAKDILDEIGVNTNVVKVPRSVLDQYIPEMADHPRYILIAEIGHGKPVLHFNGHYDVVPAAQDAFKPKFENGKIIGRGTSDMKGGIAAIIAAIKELVEKNFELEGTLQISLTPDEEIGGMCGVGYMLERLDPPDWAIIAEPSSCRDVWIGHKGVLWGEIETRGKSAHASTPDAGENAVEKCIATASSLLNLKSKIEKRTTAFNSNVKKATLELTQIEGGIKVNVIPNKAVLRFDRRVLPEEEMEDVIEEISRSVGDFRVILKVEPFVNKNSKIASQIKSILQSKGMKSRSAISSGFMDIRFFGKAGSDVVAFGPGDMLQAHSSREYVELEKVIFSAGVFTELAIELLKKSYK